MKTNAKQRLYNLSKKKLNGFNTFELYLILSKVPYEDITLLKYFLDHYYGTSMPRDFYRLFMHSFRSDEEKELLDTLKTKNIYDLINFLKKSDISLSDESIQASDYFEVPERQIRFISGLIRELEQSNKELPLKKSIEEKPEWKLRRTPYRDEEEIRRIAIKMILSIGLNNSIDLLSNKYGEVDYESIHFLFRNLNIQKEKAEDFQEFLFGNKKDQNNTMRLMLSGELNEIFLNFDYFYNSLEAFIEKLGNKLNRNKVILLLKERYLSPRLENPELSGDILQDMISSYYHKYDITEKESKVIEKNLQAYKEKLKQKTKSSIKRVEIPKIGNYSFEMIPLKDPRNLVMGYRAGNCFRINGDAFILFNNFLTNPHMRLLSISTEEYKDFGMVLLMRNGNVLVAQGIETSKRVPNELLGRKLYEATKQALEEIMNHNPELVVSIIGLTNQNTIPYNQNRLPFIINPILNDNHQYYNGIDNYQGLVSLKEGNTIHDLKLYIPETLYSDQTNQIFRRHRHDGNDYNYREIEKILISLRFAKFQETTRERMIYYYGQISGKEEDYTTCTYDWFIRVFKDGTIDTYIHSDDPEVQKEYEEELEKAKEYCKKRGEKHG